MSFRAECLFGVSVILEWVSFRATCLLGLGARLHSSFSFNVYIIGGFDRMYFDLIIIGVCVCVFVLR